MQEFELEEMRDLEDRSSNLSQEAYTSKQAADANLAMFLALEAIENSKISGSPSQMAAMANFSLNTAMEAIGGESFASYQNLTLEELAREKSRFWDRFKHHFASYYKQRVDLLQTFFTFTEFQTRRLKKIKMKLSDLRNKGSVEVRTPLSKYMRYGDNQKVSDSKTYISEFKKMTEVMVRTCEAASDMNDASKFDIGSYLVSKVTWNGDEFVMDHFRTLNELVRKVISSENMKTVRKTEVAEVAATENLLGMSQVVCKVPLKNLVKYNDYDTALELVGHIYMFVDRIEKFSTETLSSRSDFLSFDRKQIDELIKLCDVLLTESTDLLSFSKKYNTFVDEILASIFATFSAPVLNATYKDTRISPQDVDIIPSIRIIGRYASMCYDCTSSSYNFSMGNIKKALSIVESYIKRAE